MISSENTARVEDLLFRVEGMHCIKCIRKIQSVGSHFQSLRGLNVHLGEHLVTLEAREDFPVEDFMEEIRAEGFKIVTLPKSSNQDLIKLNQKKLLMRIGVAGFCAGNIMLLAVAAYLGASIEGWPGLFTYLSALIFTPILFYSAWPLFESSWASIKSGGVSIDSPIALALVGGSALSFYNLIFRTEGPTYFDSLSMFVFFLMASRFAVHRIQTKYISGITTKDVFDQTRAVLVENGRARSVKSEEIKVDDLVRVGPNAFIGFDGHLESEEAVIDDAFYTGEFLPKIRAKLDKVFAGTKNVGGSIDIKVSKVLKDSRISSLVSNLNKSLQSKTAIQTLADRGAFYLTLAIILAAAVILAYFSLVNIEEGVNRVLALLVVACPCGLAIAVPLAQTIGVKRAFKNKLLIKNVDVLESMGKIKNVVFDKTGTLTLGLMKVSKVAPGALNSLEKDLIFNLEEKSEHPIALALRKFVGKRKSLDLRLFKELPGLGVSAVFKDDQYMLVSSKKSEGFVELRKNDQVLKTFYLEDQIDPDAKNLVSKFQTDGIETYILSGDKKKRALELGKSVGIDKKNIFFEKSPEQKESFIKNELVDTLYIGDGVNDSLAMSQSLVSVSMLSSADVAFKSSKVHILNGGLGALHSLLKVSEISVQTMKIIILISLIYNIVFAFFAAFGFISPLVAVIIMPLSSVTITFLGFYLMTSQNKGLQ